MKAAKNMRESKKKVNELFEKYRTDACNREEFDELLDLVGKGEHDTTLHRLLKQQWDAEVPRSTRKISSRWYSAAAVLLLLITTTILLWRSGGDATHTLSPQQENNLLSGITHIQLPDGSSVMLRDGSWLNVDSSFAGNSREVSLRGEAYFDVVSNPGKPFIIHTGNVKTTVLGTAFTIKANPADPVITITVTRGKVKVEDEQTLLATLEADRQLVYNTRSNRITEQTVDAGIASEWRSNSLIFRNSTFESIVQEISSIYEVTILFENEALKQRQITASLDNRDAIETILDILCTAQRAYYVMEGETYVIKSLNE
jgi:ferric-dicitrate binding protein FerR (iron transport regulator)